MKGPKLQRKLMRPSGCRDKEDIEESEKQPI